MRKKFSLRDLERECIVEYGCHDLGGGRDRLIGLKVKVPEELHSRYPYNASAYHFLQELRQAIFEFGTIEFPGLPVNKTNYTLAQRSPKEHSYSSNTYLTDFCQSPHQDTPPYPTAFWLPDFRRYSATWIMSAECANSFYHYQSEHRSVAIEDIHRKLVPASLASHSAVLLNHEPGLLLIDNSEHQQLYHARTVNFAAFDANPDHDSDTPMYAFNEPGLLNYIDQLDSRRGQEYRCQENLRQVQQFMQQENM